MIQLRYKTLKGLSFASALFMLLTMLTLLAAGCGGGKTSSSASTASVDSMAAPPPGGLEKDELTLGFIKLTVVPCPKSRCWRSDGRNRRRTKGAVRWPRQGQERRLSRGDILCRRRHPRVPA